MFSKTTMESSTKIPMQSAIPIKDIILKVKPAIYIKKKVAIKETGIATITAEEDFHPRKNRYKTRLVVIRPSSKVCNVFFKELLMKSDWL